MARIIHVTPWFAPAWAFGGPPRSVLALCQAQQAAGLDVEVFTTTASPGGDLPAAPEGRVIDGIHARYFALSRPRRLLGARGMSGCLATALEGADVAHLHGLFNRTAWMAARRARRAGVPLVVSPRGMLHPAARRHHRWRKDIAWLAVDRRIVAQAACLHATSADEAVTLRAVAPQARVVTIPNPVAVSVAGAAEVAAARARVGVPAGTPFVLFLGRIHPIKRLDLLADAFVRLGATHPGAHLVIAGPDDVGHRAAIESRFAPAAARVHWCGPVDGAVKAGLLSAASALVCCSDSESFGMSIAEALGAGTPVVATQTCPWPEIAAAGLGHWVPHTAGALATALSAVLTHPEEAAAQGARARQYATRHLAPDAVGARWVQAYAEMRGKGSLASTAR